MHANFQSNVYKRLAELNDGLLVGTWQHKWALQLKRVVIFDFRATFFPKIKWAPICFLLCTGLTLASIDWTYPHTQPVKCCLRNWSWQLKRHQLLALNEPYIAQIATTAFWMGSTCRTLKTCKYYQDSCVMCWGFRVKVCVGGRLCLKKIHCCWRFGILMDKKNSVWQTDIGI